MGYIINSLLDTDFYKYTMMQPMFHQFPFVNAEFEFKCRTENINFQPIVQDLQQEIDNLCRLRLSNGELGYLEHIPYLSQDFIELLSLMKLNRKHINVNFSDENNLEISTNGSWYQTTLFEVPILSTVNELYFRQFPFDQDKAIQKVLDKIDLIKSCNDLYFSDFGTRRRNSFNWQRTVLSLLIRNLQPDNPEKPSQFTGTSNLYFAKEFGVKYIGTMAHEWICAGQGLDDVRLSMSQKYMLNAWRDEYDGALGIALSDTIGVDAFLKDFSLGLAKLYDGTRCDSGNPFEYGDKLIDHYKRLRLNPKDKTIIFSDSLSIPKAIEICDYFRDRIRVAFGIGTNLMNDIPGQTPLNIVMKMVRCNGRPVAKISDSKGKSMCKDYRFVSYLKSVFDKKPSLFEPRSFRFV